MDSSFLLSLTCSSNHSKMIKYLQDATKSVMNECANVLIPEKLLQIDPPLYTLRLSCCVDLFCGYFDTLSANLIKDMRFLDHSYDAIYLIC